LGGLIRGPLTLSGSGLTRMPESIHTYTLPQSLSKGLAAGLIGLAHIINERLACLPLVIVLKETEPIPPPLQGRMSGRPITVSRDYHD
jgi:hypothetical protein